MKIEENDIKLGQIKGDQTRVQTQIVTIENGELAVSNGFIMVRRRHPGEINKGGIRSKILKRLDPCEISFKETSITFTDGDGVSCSIASETGYPLSRYDEPVIKLKDIPVRAHIALNIKLLREILSALPDSGNIFIRIRDYKSAVEMHCDGTDALIMPMYIEEQPKYLTDRVAGPKKPDEPAIKPPEDYLYL